MNDSICGCRGKPDEQLMWQPKEVVVMDVEEKVSEEDEG